MAGFNWFLILIAIVITLVVFSASVYLLVYFQHPEDRNQAWLPKIVVVFGFSLAVLTVLLFPLDVANRGACDAEVVLSACNLTLPMRGLWFTVYILNVCLVFAIIPFTLFYYEGDSDLTTGQKISSAFVWVLLTLFVLGLVLGIFYGLFGFVEYPTQKLSSGVLPISQLGGIAGCIKVDNQGVAGEADTQCDASSELSQDNTATWKIRVSFPVYVIALASIIGWVLFMLFAGMGLLSLPVDLIMSFFSKPKATITKSEYMNRARALAEKVNETKKLALELKKQERAGTKKGQVRKNARELGKQVAHMEEEDQVLSDLFPQGEDRDSKWTMYMLSYFIGLLVGIVFFIVAVVWIIHIIIYMLVSPPLHPFLNDFFTTLDDTFPLFGVCAFGVFSFFLIAAAIKGHITLSQGVGFLNVYPMRQHGTLMSSMLVNVGLILLTSTAVIQFCSAAFQLYAQQTAIVDIFGIEILHLKGIRYIFQSNAFVYVMLGIAFLTLIYYMVRGPLSYQQIKKRKQQKKYIY